jgi:hypothetical protein
LRMARWRPERGKVTGASELVSTIVATTPVIDGKIKRIMAMWWRYSDTWRKAVRRRFTGEPIGFHRDKLVRWSDLFYRPDLSTVMIFPGPRALSTHPEHNLDWRRHESWRREVVGGEHAALAI